MFKYARSRSVLSVLTFIAYLANSCTAWGTVRHSLSRFTTSDSHNIKSRVLKLNTRHVWLLGESEISSDTPISAQRQDFGPMTREQLLRAVPAAVSTAAVMAGSMRPSSAALPTPEDYAFGNGSQAKKGQAKDVAARPLPNVNRKNVVEVVGALPAELEYLQSLIEKQRWGDALERLKTFPLTALRSPTLGLGSVGEVATTLGVTNNRAFEILDASVEAGLTLREVEDVVFSNTRTLQFFNDVDLKQVQDMALKVKPADTTEPLQFLSETKRLVDAVVAMIAAPP